MSYNPAIPQGTDVTLKSQAQIRANYQSIDTVFAQNHVQMNKNLQGMHKVLTMRPTNLAGDPTTDATHVAFYNKIVATLPQLFYRPNNNQTPIQLTYPSLSTTTGAAQQYTFIAGPFVVYAGLISPASKGQVIALTPATTLVYVGLVTKDFKGSPSAVPQTIPASIAGNSFTIQSQTFIGGTTFSVYYIAIGV